MDYETYLDWLELDFKEVQRVTKTPVLCDIVIGTIYLYGKNLPQQRC